MTTKPWFMAALAVVLSMPYAAAQSILQRSDWQERTLETYLPPPAPTVPWLDLNTKTKLPKGDLPLGRDAEPAEHFVLPPFGADTQLSSNTGATPRSM